MKYLISIVSNNNTIKEHFCFGGFIQDPLVYFNVLICIMYFKHFFQGSYMYDIIHWNQNYLPDKMNKISNIFFCKLR